MSTMRVVVDPNVLPRHAGAERFLAITASVALADAADPIVVSPSELLEELPPTESDCGLRRCLQELRAESMQAPRALPRRA